MFYNRYDARITEFEHNERKLRKLFGENLLKSKISKSSSNVDAVNISEPINKILVKNASAREYLKLTYELCKFKKLVTIYIICFII
ncbi:MAG: hypothetical protein ACOCRK_06150 [bacterium]